MFCFILDETCDLSPALRMYVKKLQTLRNKLCHMSDATLNDSKYEEYIEKIDCCFEKCLKEINDSDFTEELNYIVSSVRHGPLALEDTLRIMHAFYKMDNEQMKILEKHSKDHENFSNKQDQMMAKLESIESRLPDRALVDVPAVEIVIEVKNCTSDKEAKVYEFLVKRLNELIDEKEPELEDDISNGALHKIREILQQTLKDLFALGRHVIRVEQKCILLQIKCTSLSAFVNLIRDYRSDQLTHQLSGIQKAFRFFDGCSDVELDTCIFEDTFWRVMDELVVNLEEQIPKQYTLLPVNSNTELADRRSLPPSNGGKINGLDDIRLAGCTRPENGTAEKRYVRITVQMPTHDQKQLQEHFESGDIDHGMETLQEEIGEQLQIKNVSITARLVLQGDGMKKDESRNELPRLKEQQTLKYLEEKEAVEEIDNVANRQCSSLQDASDNDTITKYEEESVSSDDDSQAEVVGLSESIENLINDGYTALESDDEKHAFMCTSEAEKIADHLLMSSNSLVSDKKLSGWYEDCSFILNQVREFMTATRCYYKAIVFDNNWTKGRHKFMSDMLWGFTITTNLETIEPIKNLGTLLTEIEELAKLAERRKGWSVCLAIDEDLNKVYNYLQRFRNVAEIPKTREQSLRRLARCNHKLGLHKETRQYCVKILKETCDYDDTEALEIWAQSLFETEDYDLAYDKCQLAKTYCKDADVNRLQNLQQKIQTKMKKADVDQTKPDMEWLKGTNVTNTETASVTKDQSEEKVKTRHKRPKAKDRSENAAQSLQSQRKIKIDHESIVRANNSTKCVPQAIIGLQNEESRRSRSRNSSLCSTTTNETDVSAFEPETYLSSSPSDTDENSEEEYVRSSPTEFPNTFSIPDFNREEEDKQETMSLYEQSYKLHIENQQSTFLDEVMKNESLLKTGACLNQDYLDRFETDKGPNVRSREEFYSTEFSKKQLLQKLIQDPEKYVKCVIHVEGAHEAFCTPVDSSNPTCNVIEITGRSKIGQVFNEDVVVVELLDGNWKVKRYGKVLGILERQRHRDVKHPVFICTLDNVDIHLMKPVCKTVPKVYVLDDEISKEYKVTKERLYKIQVYHLDEENGVLCNPKIIEIDPAKKDSFVCLVAYINWKPCYIYPSGAVIKILPPGNDVSSGLNILNLKYEVPRLFDKDTVEEVEKIVTEERDGPAEHRLRDRTDLTKNNVFTIGKEDSEPSCAFSIDTLDTGYKVGVHVADVATYIPKDSSLDKEAKRRTTTFKSDIRKPRNMIPEPLHPILCIQPDKKRLAISVFLYVTETGIPMQTENNYEIVKSYIKCKRHLTEDEAQSVVNGQTRGNDEIAKDVKTLFDVASLLRSRRLGNAKYSLDWNESQHDTINPARALKECLLMANMKIAGRILRSCKQVVPIYYKPSPAKAAVESFLQKYDTYIDSLLSLQNKQIGPKKPTVDYCKKSPRNIFLSKLVWDAMVASPGNASQYIRKDEIHPLQATILSSWRSIQNDREFRSSGSLDKVDINKATFTSFTSPLENYCDLIMQRFIHEVVFQKNSQPYTKDEIDSICVHMNSVVKRARQYNKECRLLRAASKMKEGHVIINCSVEEISERGITLCSPFLSDIAKGNKELAFSLLNLSTKPFIFEDSVSKWNCVQVEWRKRLYDFSLHVISPSARGHELQLNPHGGVVHLPLQKWAKLIQFMIDKDNEGLSRAIKKAKVVQHDGLEDVSTECLDTLEIQPYTTFSMRFMIGNQVKIQLSSAFHGGIISPKPIVYDMTNNVKFCLQHTEDPVLHLCRYATRTTCEKYKSIDDYLDRWIPILLMESATGVCSNEETCNISNVPVKWSMKKKRKGSFRLSLAHCEVRNIEFSGTISDDDEEENDALGALSFDWLCLKGNMPTYITGDGIMQALQQPYFVWVGHADITKVKKSKEAFGGKHLTVSFKLRDESPDFPLTLFPDSADVKLNVEILRKKEMDRRTESFLKMLPKVEGSLAAKIALNLPVPNLDRSRKHIADIIERDLYFENSSLDPKRRPLPRNNVEQQDAINKALMERFSLIQGPPGSGKTYTGIKLIYLFNKTNDILHKEGRPKKQVLFCGPSNKSVDLVAKWMINRMGEYCPKFVRVYGRSIETIDFPIPGRTFQSKRSTRSQRTPKALYSVALHHLIRTDGRKYASQIKDFDQMFKQYEYKPMPLQVKQYVHLVREASIDEIRKYDVILCTTAVGSNSKVLQATNVYQVIIDEAGMCTEPQCLVPIIATKAEQVVLIGDHKQLKPIIMCKEAALLGLETSLFERYANTNVTFTMLKEQFRMNPNICKFPSQEFYGDSLITMPGLWRSKRMEIWPKMDRDVFPHVFVHVEGEEKILTVSTEDGNEHSRSNLEEIEHVVNVYSYLVGMKQSHESVQILSQYNAQCAEIRRKLQKNDFDVSDEGVSTVVSSQGGEWDYVIFSTVRSLPEYKIEKRPTLGWRKHNLGFIMDRNQINVAITRARKGLVIIGNRNLLVCDPVWKNLLMHYETRGCIKTTEEFPPTFARFSQLLRH